MENEDVLKRFHKLIDTINSITPQRHLYVLCQWVPFPDEQVIKAYKDIGGVIVIDRQHNMWRYGEPYTEEEKND